MENRGQLGPQHESTFLARSEEEQRQVRDQGSAQTEAHHSVLWRGGQ